MFTPLCKHILQRTKVLYECALGKSVPECKNVNTDILNMARLYDGGNVELILVFI